MASEGIALGLLVVGVVFFFIASFVNSNDDESENNNSIPYNQFGQYGPNTQHFFNNHYLPPNAMYPINYNQMQVPLQTNPVDIKPPPLVEEKIMADVYDHNPSFFQLQAYLYLDFNITNVYTGEDVNFKLNDITSIRRFGQGTLSYDGLVFAFDHKNGRYLFPLKKVKHISFYLNCLVISQKDKEPAALIFLENTKYVKDVLEAFQKKES